VYLRVYHHQQEEEEEEEEEENQVSRDFHISPAQSADCAASEAEAARPEVHLIHDTHHGPKDFNAVTEGRPLEKRKGNTEGMRIQVDTGLKSSRDRGLAQPSRRAISSSTFLFLLRLAASSSSKLRSESSGNDAGDATPVTDFSFVVSPDDSFVLKQGKASS
jgi:hypothetical protein